MKLWSILGNSQKLDGGAMFGNAPKAMWERWSRVDADNRIDLACRALLASPLNGKTVLFETGIGAFFEPKLRERYGVQEPHHVLLGSLLEAGFSHEDIDVVVLSHLHFDHAGGLLAAWEEGQPPRRLPPELRVRARDKLALLHQARRIEDLRIPPGNRLELLSGKRAGQWSIRVNDQWRICFRFEGGNAHDVELIDYH